MRVLAIVLCLTGLPLSAWQQSEVTDEQDTPHPPRASVAVRTTKEGDVGITLFLNRERPEIDLTAVVRKALACDWQASKANSFSSSGVCRHLLHSDRGAVDDRLDLAPLTATLFDSGIQQVYLSLVTKGEPVATGGPSWQTSGKAARATAARHWYYRARAGEALPPPFVVRAGVAWKPNRLGAPLLFVLTGPALLAAWVRRQMARKKTEPGAGTVWLNWLLLGSWLYWISAMRIEDIGGFAGVLSLHTPMATLLIGALVYAVPPLAATAACLTALAPQAQPGSDQRGQLGRIIRQTLASEATFVVPMGLFLVGSTLFEDSRQTGMLSMVAAYAAYRLLAWCTWKWAAQRMLPLDGGALRERSVAIAAAAGVNLRAVSVLENRFPMEANAFAMGDGRISFTRGLLENLSWREVDAVAAHEIGHLRGKHVGMRTGLFLAYMIVIGPALGYVATKTGMPEWVMALPIAPLLYVLAAGQLSQRNELNADARAVALTNDPEGTIAALARLARLSRSPVDWGGIQGSILSHPSMRKRVLAVAQRCGVAESRALELLANPDALTGDGPESSRYDLPEPQAQAEPVFTATAKLSHAYWTPWIFGTTLILFMVSAVWMAVLVKPEQPLWDLGIFLVSLPLSAWLTLRVDDWLDCWFIRRMKRRIERHGARGKGTFVALVPGDRILHFESQYAWDLGRVEMCGDRLTYRGERTQFSVPRSDIHSVEVRKGPLGWCRTYAVVVRSAQAAFSLRLADRGRTRRLARGLEKQIHTWWRGETMGPAMEEAEVLPLALPDLPVLQPATASRLRIAWVFGIRTVLLFFATIFVFSASSLLEHSSMFALVPFTAPLVYLVVVCPSLLRPQS